MTENQNRSRNSDSSAGPDDLPGGERPFLQRPQGVIAVAGGVVTVVAGALGLVFLLFPDAQPKPRPEPLPGVELVDFDLEKEEEIQADWTGEGDSGVMPDWKASLVTVMLRNGGDNPVLVSRAEFNFSSITEVGCPYGGGPAEIKARYDVKVPPGTQAPFEQVRKMRYTLPPHEQERVAFTVGPESIIDGALPQVYTFTITLHLDDKTRIEIPEMIYMDPSNSEYVLRTAENTMRNAELLNPSAAACVRKQERKARELVAGSKNISSELKDFSAELTRLVSLSPSPA